jgi:hypothetical protein
VAGMSLYVVTDAGRQFIRRRKRGAARPPSEPPAAPPPAPQPPAPAPAAPDVPAEGDQ